MLQAPVKVAMFHPDNLSMLAKLSDDALTVCQKEKRPALLVTASSSPDSSTGGAPPPWSSHPQASMNLGLGSGLQPPDDTPKEVLLRKVGYLREWMSQLQTHYSQQNSQGVQECVKVFIGGIPSSTSNVG